MDVKQVIEKRGELEQLICDAVRAFEQETETTVNDIDLLRAEVFGKCRPELVAAECELSIK